MGTAPPPPPWAEGSEHRSLLLCPSQFLLCGERDTASPDVPNFQKTTEMWIFFKSKIPQLLNVKANSNTKKYCVGQIKPVRGLELAGFCKLWSSQTLSSIAVEGASRGKRAGKESEREQSREAGRELGRQHRHLLQEGLLIISLDERQGQVLAKECSLCSL